MHRLAHALIAAEGEGEVGDAAGDMRVRQLGLDAPRRLDIGEAVIIVLLDAGGDGEDVRIEDDVFRRKADLLGQELVGALADLEFALRRLGLARLVEGHHDDGGAIAPDLLGVLEKGSSPSFRLMELTIALPCTHFSPASITGHFDESIMIGTREMSGSAAIRLRKVTMAAFAIEHALVHVDVEDVGAVLDLLARHFQRGIIIAGLDQLAEFGGAGDVGPLADHDEILRRVTHSHSPMDEGLKAGEAHLVLDLRHAARRVFRDGMQRWRGYAQAWCRSTRRRC